ncbi:Hypothetical predicted protein [Cloeon dipterum]|uniref:Uncharacterized protein n=1 Tax=Cloeon dipterum TaxID=197152 RepID=A0A8S1DZE6_9INSE|nr:Hypothetical predicted protein [Cloeon dipterum]
MENATADDDWWADAEEMDSLMPVSALQNLVDIPLSSESISSIGFLPPPPRPSAEILALDELGSEAFTSSCDLCSWAWSNPAFAIDPNRISPLAPVSYGELGWTLTLIIVALLSAVIGAIVTVTILHCRRMKGIQSSCCNSEDEDEGRTASSTPENQNPQNPFAGDNKTPPLPSSRRPRGGFWSRLFNRHPISSRGRCESSLQRRPPRRLCPPAPPTNENHYTVTGRYNKKYDII